jgi:hypothetical protein
MIWPILAYGAAIFREREPKAERPPRARSGAGWGRATCDGSNRTVHGVNPDFPSVCGRCRCSGIAGVLAAAFADCLQNWIPWLG